MTDNRGLEGNERDEVIVSSLGEGKGGGGAAETGEIGEALAAAHLHDSKHYVSTEE